MRALALLIIMVSSVSCLEITQSPYTDLSPFVAAALGNGSTVSITVTGANQNNTNKSTLAPAVQLWAATTRYQTTGFTQEKIQLTSSAGISTGVLPIVDDSTVTIIIWDDVLTLPHPSGGGAYVSAEGISSMTLTPTSQYFSPCDGGFGNRNGLKAFYNLVDITGGTAPAGLASPGLGAILASSGVAASATNDEVYTVIANQVRGAIISVVYQDLQKADFNLFCNCQKSVKVGHISTSPTPSAVVSGLFTDTTITSTSGACPTR